MQTLVQPDINILNLIAPSGGVVQDVPIMIGDICVIPVTSADAGDLFAGYTRGVFRLPKTTGAAYTVGEKLEWDVDAGKLVPATGTVEDDFELGYCVEAAGSSDTYAKVAVGYYAPTVNPGA